MPSKHSPTTPKPAGIPLLFILIIIIVAAVSIFFFRKPTTYNPQLTTYDPQLLKNLPVPEVKSLLKDKNIAVPLAAVESTPGAKTKIRQFNLQAYKSAFQPNIILVYAGDIVRISLYASDNIYDFSIPAHNISQTAQKGETKSIEFQVTNTGTFNIVCSSCTEPDKPRGYLGVKELVIIN